eukprot:gene4158-8189_t
MRWAARVLTRAEEGLRWGCAGGELDRAAVSQPSELGNLDAGVRDLGLAAQLDP